LRSRHAWRRVTVVLLSAAVAWCVATPAFATQQVTAIEVEIGLPAAPADVMAVARPGAARIAWSAPVTDGGSPITAYRIAVAPGPLVVDVAAPATATVIEGLADGTSYDVIVTALSAAGYGDEAHASVTPDAAAGELPSAPLAVTATAGDTVAAVTWAPPTDDGGQPVTAYRVTRSTATGAVSGMTTQTSLSQSGLVNGTAYRYSVAAVTAIGTGPATLSPSVKPIGLPTAPTSVRASAQNARATVRWTASNGNGTAVRDYRVVASPGGRAVTTTSTSAVVTGLTNGVAYRFSVSARNLLGRGPSSSPSAAVTPRVPAHFTSIRAASPLVRYGTVSAALVDSSGHPLAGHDVDLRARRPGTKTWVRVATARTGTTGRATLRATLKWTSWLSVRHRADAASGSTLSVPSVHVATKLSGTPSGTTFRAGVPVTFRGNIAPARPAGSRVLLQRWDGSAWRDLAAGKLTSTTTFSVTWRPADRTSWQLRVIKPADSSYSRGASPRWAARPAPETRAEVATAILRNGRITLARSHVSGVSDSATPYQNIVDTAHGYAARRSSYGTAPGGSVALDMRVLQTLRHLGSAASYSVSEIAGGTHAGHSLHYSGRAFDVNIVNGASVRGGSGYWVVVDACRAYGATNIYYPAHDPYGGHQNHVHCDWA
jgi:hypothetical protein